LLVPVRNNVGWPSSNIEVGLHNVFCQHGDVQLVFCLGVRVYIQVAC
jgi:hypothetical protein